jgi:hypothetical protein
MRIRKITESYFMLTLNFLTRGLAGYFLIFNPEFLNTLAVVLIGLVFLLDALEIAGILMLKAFITREVKKAIKNHKKQNEDVEGTD